MSRFLFLVLLHASTAAQPNVLVLFPDQWRHDWTPEDLPQLVMPHYSALRARGTRFRKAFVPSPLCAPSRACLASGREYDRAGVPDNFSNDFPINVTTFMTLLRDGGYDVMTSGKDDLTKATGPSINGSYHAEALGYSQWARCDGKSDAAGKEPHDPYGAFCAANSEVVGGRNMTFWEIYNNDMGSCAKAPGSGSGYDCIAASPLPQAAYEDDYVAANAVSLLAAATAPWFLQVSFPGPHPPFVVTAPMKATTASDTFPLAADNKQLAADVQQEVRRDYAAELVNLDRLFGKVMAAIPPADAANTIIIVASDHGEMLGDHQDWGKTMPWQGSVSVPLVIAGPGLPVGATVDAPVATMDIAGTVLDFAGIAPAEGMSTVSLRPYLSAAATASSASAAYRPFVSSGLGEWRAVMQTRPDATRLKLVCCAGGACPGQPRNDSTVFIGDSGEDEDAAYAAVLRGAARTAPHRPASDAAPIALLFDLDADPFDMNDVAAERPKALHNMSALLPKGWCGGTM